METQKETIQKIAEIIEKNNAFILVSHNDQDGDAIGSLMALGLYLKEQRDKDVAVHLRNGFPAKYNFLVGRMNELNKMPNRPDVIFVLDTSSPERIDSGFSIYDHPDAYVVNIDHHSDNIYFGDFNWVESHSPAVGVLIYNLLNELGADFTPDISTNLYTTVLTDTGGFMFSNTTPEVLEIAAFLTKKGAQPGYIAGQLYLNHSMNYLKNMGIALNNLRFYAEGKIIFLTLDNSSVKALHSSFRETEGIVDFTLRVKGAIVGVLFKEINSDLIRVSLRSDGTIDVAHICAEFGGGGHHNAAGCTFNNNLIGTQEIILHKILHQIKNHD
ncbi:hypothetical protein JXI42_12810 [bacterium]|nr:hypothetical protein [bacterium]